MRSNETNKRGNLVPKSEQGRTISIKKPTKIN